MSTFVIGLSLAALLFILAAGLVLVFGLLGVINLAHGAFYMLGAYAGYQIAVWTGSFWLALVLAPLFVAAAAWLAERLTLSKLYNREHYLQFLLTFGLILVINELVRLTWGVGYLRLDAPDLLQGSVDFGTFQVSVYRLFVACAGLMAAVVLYLVLERTLIGTVVRAASANSAMVSCLGVNVRRIRSSVFAVGGGLAGFAGVIAAPLVPLSLDMGLIVIIDCFLVIIIGGMGSIRGAVLGSILIGMTRAYGQNFIPQFIDPLTFGVLVTVLLVRPSGIFGRKERMA